MLDWKRITQTIEHAMTLDGPALAEFLGNAPDKDDTLEAARRLIARLRPGAGFMQTSAPEAANEDEAPLPAGARIGVWSIEERIGRGGMGEVYRARRADELYDQTVALKLIHGTTPARAERFEMERRRLALMTHPGVSRIVDGGQAPDGRPYMAMEFVDGVPIDQYAEQAGLGRAQRLALFAALCSAVSHAHAKLILHRDIKAGNVLVDAAGHVRLIDFGISAELDEEGSDVGPLTLASAAPEQLKGERSTVQTDVFALGALLHQLLVGALPERQADGGMAVEEGLVADADLAAILGCALASDPGERYVSVDALRDDVVAYVHKQPVAARAGGAAYRMGKFLRRFPLASALAASVVLALAVGLVASLKFAGDARAEAARAQAALARADWQWGRTEANLSAQQAYSDVLQRAFGGDEDAEHLSELMMQRWREAFDARESDPDAAAAVSYAVGRNFYFRGDVKRALEIFDPWMAEGFGPKPLVEIGEEVYALMLTDAGRMNEAEPRLRALIERFETGFKESEADLFNYAFKLARITRAPADIDRAEGLVRKLIANDTDPFQTLFHYNQLGFLRMVKDDRPGAYEAFSKTVEIFEANPNLAAYGRDIARFNLAGQELGFHRDLDRAEALARAILDEDVPLKGEGLLEGRARMLLGLVEGERGSFDAAEASLAKADALFEQYAGAGSPPHIVGLCAWASLRADAGKIEDARALLDQAREYAEGAEDKDRFLRPVTMAAIYVDGAAGTSAADLAPRLADPDLMAGVKSDAMQYYLYQRLAEKGLAPALDEAPLD